MVKRVSTVSMIALKTAIVLWSSYKTAQSFTGISSSNKTPQRLLLCDVLRKLKRRTACELWL